MIQTASTAENSAYISRTELRVSEWFPSAPLKAVLWDALVIHLKALHVDCSHQL